MCSKNSFYVSQYKEILDKINSFGSNIANDNDKIKLVGLINELKYYCLHIEPQDSLDIYNR